MRVPLLDSFPSTHHLFSADVRGKILTSRGQEIKTQLTTYEGDKQDFAVILRHTKTHLCPFTLHSLSVPPAAHFSAESKQCVSPAMRHCKLFVSNHNFDLQHLCCFRAGLSEAGCISWRERTISFTLSLL